MTKIYCYFLQAAREKGAILRGKSKVFGISMPAERIATHGPANVG
jgi:hypothetical protein